MKKNMGVLDRLTRVSLALLAGILYFANQISGIVAIILLLLAGVFILTGFIGSCPLYTALGTNTKRKNA